MAGALHVTNAATVSTTYLLVVLLVAATSRLRVAVATSVAAMLALNFFFLPPVGTFTIADPHNWVALGAFLVVSLVASNLSAVARDRTEEALGRRNELARLFDLSRDVLMMTESREALAVLARTIARRFDLEFVAVAVPRDEDWDIHAAGARTIQVDTRQLSNAYAAARTSLEFDAYARTYAGHRTTTVDGHVVRLVPLRVGTKPIGVLATAGRPVEPGTLDTLAGVVAIAIERAAFLEERKTAELTRQSEQLKTALLASLSHDLRTPLTAIRIAASNMKSSDLPRDELLEQSDLILTEVERLTRLFQNLLEMARIDAGGIATDSRWTHPSEIVAAARDQVEQALQGHQAAGRHRAGRAGAPGSAADRDSARASPGECCPVFTCRIGRERGRSRRAGWARHPGARPRSGGRAGRPAAPVRALLPRCRGENADLRHGNGPVDRARSARRRERARLGRELRGRRRAIHAGAARSRPGRAIAEGAEMTTPYTRILLVDDESSIQRAVGPLLRSRGYEVDLAGTGAQALEIFAARTPVLVVLDLGLPDIEGTEVCRRIRAISQVPIIVLSARGAEADKVNALDLGADDYVTKPFGAEELLARIRVALRRVDTENTIDTGVFRAGTLTIDYDRRRVVREDQEIRLTPKEFDLLSLLARHHDRVLTHRAILKEVWGPNAVEQPEHLWTLVAQLRKKIEPDPSSPKYLVSEPWVGYRFVTDTP